MGRRLVTPIVVAMGVVGFSCVAATARAWAASGYYVTLAARSCPAYADIYANKARNDIVESLRDLGPNTQYGNSGALVGPAYEDQAPQTNCTPLPNWTFTLGTGYQTRAVSGKWGSLSKVTGAYDTSIVTQPSTPLLDNAGNPLGGQTIAGAVTIKLSQAQATQASKSSSLWVQGGTPTDPVLASRFGTPDAPEYGFGTLRCATDNVNGDNVEYVFFPSGTNHVFCYAYYVTPPPTSGTIVVRKQVVGAPAGTNPAFPFNGNLSFDPGGFTLADGRSSTFYRAGGQTWSVTEGSVANYRLDSIRCTATAPGGGPGTSTTATSGATLSIALTAGETVDCTFVNTWVPPTGTLSIEKITRGGVGRFSFLVARGDTPTGTVVTAQSTRDGVPVAAQPESDLADLAPGTYTITETRPPSPGGGWDLTGVECNGASRNTRDVTVTITAGSRTVCTFTNRLVPGAAISLSKVTHGGTGTTAFVTESTGSQPVQYHQAATTHAAGEPAEAVPATGADATDHIPFGTYRIFEQPPLATGAGRWILTSVACDGVDMPFSDGGFLVTTTRAHPRPACRFSNTLVHEVPVDPEPGEPGEPTPPTSEPGGPPRPEGSRPEPGNFWANLSVTTRPKHRLVVRGHRIQDVVLVHNHGPSDAEEVMLDYQAPKGTELVSVRAGGRRCSRSLPLTCRLGLLKPGRRTKVTVVMVSRKRSGPFRMHAALGSATYDPALSGNAVNERVFILPPPPTQPVACGARATPVAHIAC